MFYIFLFLVPSCAFGIFVILSFKPPSMTVYQWLIFVCGVGVYFPVFTERAHKAWEEGEDKKEKKEAFSQEEKQFRWGRRRRGGNAEQQHIQQQWWWWWRRWSGPQAKKARSPRLWLRLGGRGGCDGPFAWQHHPSDGLCECFAGCSAPAGPQTASEKPLRLLRQVGHVVKIHFIIINLHSSVNILFVFQQNPEVFTNRVSQSLRQGGEQEI